MKAAFKTRHSRMRGPVFDRIRAKSCGELAQFAFDYADTMHITLPPEDRRNIAQMTAVRGAGYVEHVLARLRDFMVRPFGLKPIGPTALAPFDQYTEISGANIMGIDDRHADVRIVYQIENHGEARRLYATSLVRTHSLFGKAYLMAILPFHFLIVGRQLERICRARSTHHAEDQRSRQDD